MQRSVGAGGPVLVNCLARVVSEDLSFEPQSPLWAVFQTDKHPVWGLPLDTGGTQV
jgi:hypothetical protein